MHESNNRNNMNKKLIIFVMMASLTLLFAETKYEPKYKGTYIPLAAYTEIINTKSYYNAILATKGADFYTVLAFQEDMIRSNISFHDSYAINYSDVDFSFSNKDQNFYLTDKKSGIKYIRISESVDYYEAYDLFLTENLLIKLNINGLVQNENWKIDKDQWHYSDGIQVILYSPEEWKYIGYANEKLYLLEDGEDLTKVLGKVYLPK